MERAYDHPADLNTSKLLIKKKKKKNALVLALPTEVNVEKKRNGRNRKNVYLERSSTFTLGT